MQGGGEGLHLVFIMFKSLEHSIIFSYSLLSGAVDQHVIQVKPSHCAYRLGR